LQENPLIVSVVGHKKEGIGGFRYFFPNKILEVARMIAGNILILEISLNILMVITSKATLYIKYDINAW